jgi:hypothetical protein
MSITNQLGLAPGFNPGEETQKLLALAEKMFVLAKASVVL